MSNLSCSTLATYAPALLCEWNFERNEPLSPYSIRPFSNKKAWWKCVKGHEWEAPICSRAKGVGCPYCANHKAWPGDNDLATLRPDLAAEWHPFKNGELTPQHVTSGSDKKVWWQCTFGHEWESKIANRNHGNGCPICRKTTLSKKATQRHIRHSGSLAQTAPHLAKEWHPTRNGDTSPTDLTCNSPRKVWWLGLCGHEWEAIVSNRYRGTNCPFCSNQQLLSGYNDLQTRFPSIAAEWNYSHNAPLLPSEVLATSGLVVWWKGTCGHEWKQAIDKRTTRGQGCPICGKRTQTSFPEQALLYYIQQSHPDAINNYRRIFSNQMELDIFIPTLSVGIEYDGANWHNEDSLAKEQTKYLICQQNNIVLIRIREDTTEAAPNTCDFFFPAKRHPTPTELDSIISTVCMHLGYACSVDTQRDAADIRSYYFHKLSNKNLLIECPQLAHEWHPTKNGSLTPDMFTVSSGALIWWVCSTCGHEWQTRIATRSQGVGCKLCGYKKRTESRIKGKIALQGSLQSNNPSLAAEWHSIHNAPLSPTDVLATSAKKVWWLCSSCGHEWSATIASRNAGNGCPACNRKARSRIQHERKLQDSGSLAEQYPDLLLDWDYSHNCSIDPNSVTPGSHQKVWWKCHICGHTWETEIKYRTKGHGCASCKQKK